MKIDFKKIINIKSKKDINTFLLKQKNKPIFNDNYLFHYLIIFDKLDQLKLAKWSVHLENGDKLNAFHLAAKEQKYDILCFLIEEYPDYIYNLNANNETFLSYLELSLIPKLIKKYPDLDWEYLLENKVTDKHNIIIYILANLDYKNLNIFLDVYTKSNIEKYINYIIINNLLKDDEKIKLLDNFTDDQINYRNNLNEGIIINAIQNDNKALFSYMIKRNIDVDYFSLSGYNPLIEAIYTDINNNKYYYSKIILSKISSNLLNLQTKLLNNIIHIILYNRLSSQNQNYELDKDILNRFQSEQWNQRNVIKICPLDIVHQLDFDIYSKILSNNNILISTSNLNKIKKDLTNNINNLWLTFFNNMKTYDDNNDDNVILQDNEYAHYTLFQSSYMDTKIYFNYFANKYKNLYIPISRDNIDNLIEVEKNDMTHNVLSYNEPWVVYYHTNDDYYIHPYLNNIINSERRKGDKDYAILLLSIKIINENTLHANLLLYDFKNMTIERFEPYGIIDNDYEMDDILEEELTWNTGLTYLRPDKITPNVSFQSIADENNMSNLKRGDFGGFCLAWTLWYAESRLKNPKVEPLILVKKLIKRINNLNIKFVEYIRNYSNKMAIVREDFLEKNGINKKIASNAYLDINTIDKINTSLH